MRSSWRLSEQIGKLIWILKFDLRERPDNAPPLHCAVSEEMLEDAKAALGEKVNVAGTVKRDKTGRINLLRVKALNYSLMVATLRHDNPALYVKTTK